MKDAMKLLADQDNKKLLATLALVWAGAFLLAQGCLCLAGYKPALWLVPVFLLGALASGAVCLGYLDRQNATLEQATAAIRAYLDGDKTSRIECDREGELYRLFHTVNSLAAVLNAHADNEQREKAFLKTTISDISHQLKTPLAALNIYNGLLQQGGNDDAAIRELADLSEQELDRMETLVKNLLKMARLDAGTLTLEKRPENVADMMQDVQQHFAYRAKQEQKTLTLTGAGDVTLLCDRAWLSEAVDNLVKNALDHTKPGDTVTIGWKSSATLVQITVADNGSGIHPEDLHHIFKRFYRSRFSQDTQGVGLGLPLAKAIVEAHGGTIGVDSTLGQGTVFTLDFLIPTKL